ncbi:MAG TPA: transcriptional regulator [Bacillota bacterium]|nr:transcriptional regulator [Bacillota bacterium]
MSLYYRVLKGVYRDSVALMRVSGDLAATPGVERISVLMGTAANRALFEQAGLLGGGIPAAGPNDLCIAASFGPPATEADVAARVEAALAAAAPEAVEVAAARPRSLRGAGAQGWAVVSVPGPFAAAEAGKAIHLGMDVFLFSNGVSLQDEMALKRLATAHGRLVMGPDAGTALVQGVPLGFCNAWPAGHVGVVAASGTGTQEVACQLARRGIGISQIIGAGSRDLHAEVGGATVRAGLRRLEQDPETEVVLFISKSGGAALRTEKPCIALVLDETGQTPQGAVRAEDTDQAARLVAGLGPSANLTPVQLQAAAAWARSLPEGRRWLRGLFSGGTLALQAVRLIPGAVSAEPAPGTAADPLGGALAALGPGEHRVLDMGDEAFTVGRPHPIVDVALRGEAMRNLTPDTAVVLFDVVLGRLAHPDPAGALAERLQPGPLYVASVCGAPGDPQGYDEQCARLRAAGVWVADGAAQAARIAAAILAEVAA